MNTKTNSAKTNRKMSSEEMDQLLAGRDRNGADCDLDGEAKELKQMFATLRENSMATAERHHSTAQLAAQRTAQRVSSVRPHRFVWAGALAAVAVVASVPLEVHHRREAKADAARAQEAAMRKQQMEQRTDEALLMDVQSDLSSSVAQPLAPLTVKFVSDTIGNTKGSNE